MNVDKLAELIRRVDGNNNMGAGALAEALFPHLSPIVATAKELRDRFIAEYGHDLAIAMGIDYFDLLDRDAKIIARLENPQIVATVPSDEQMDIRWLLDEFYKAAYMFGETTDQHHYAAVQRLRTRIQDLCSSTHISTAAEQAHNSVEKLAEVLRGLDLAPVWASASPSQLFFLAGDVQDEYEAFCEWYEKEAPVEGEVSEVDMARHGWLAGRRSTEFTPIKSSTAVKGNAPAEVKPCQKFRFNPEHTDHCDFCKCHKSDHALAAKKG